MLSFYLSYDFTREWPSQEQKTTEIRKPKETETRNSIGKKTLKITNSKLSEV
jgi:hypothetical protein